MTAMTAMTADTLTDTRVDKLALLQVPLTAADFLGRYYGFDDTADWQLTLHQHIYTLLQRSTGLALRIDFRQGKYRYRNHHKGKEPLLQAVKIKKRLPERLIDATPGVLKDSFMLAGRGIHVTAIERNPLLYLMVKQSLSQVACPIDYYFGEAADRLGDFPAPVIYLDPMYPPRHKSAAVKKAMQILHRIVGSDADAAHLFRVARQQHARVVVKRPAYAASLSTTPPDFICRADKRGATRFEVYL